MSVAIRTATRLQDQDDVNVTLGAGVDEYALCWDNDTARFVLRGGVVGVTDHGALTGLADDDHTGYALLAGRAGGQTLYGGNAANDGIIIHGTANATRATSYVLLQPTAGYVGVGTTTPYAPLSVVGNAFPVLSVVRTTTATNAFTSSTILVMRSSDNIVNEFGSGLVFAVQDDAIANDNYSAGLLAAIGAVRAGADNTGDIVFRTYSTGSVNERMRITSTGRVGIGTTAPSSRFHALLLSTETNVVSSVATISHKSLNTVAAGFGADQLYTLQSSTTDSQNAARIQALWNDATHATRKADLVLTAYDSGGEREGLRIRANGSAPALGFFGTTPAARPTGVAVTAAGIHAALVTLGLITA